MPAPLLAFDVYGTLIDPGGITVQLREVLGEKASAAASLWREKQLEFTFRRALMGRYVNFDVCTAQALDCVLAQVGGHISGPARQNLLDSYRRLPAYPEVELSLAALQAAGYEMIALTNGTETSVHSLLQHAGLRARFQTILSADSIQTFKPDPAVYELARRVGQNSHREVWLVSGNPFDIIGAKAQGLSAAWVRRDPTRIFDPWEFSPDVTVPDLGALCQELHRFL